MSRKPAIPRKIILMAITTLLASVLLSSCGTGCPPTCLGEREGAVDWSNKKMQGAHLIGSDLRQAILSGVDLAGADLSGVDLSNANLKSAKLNRAYIIGSNLQGAFLSGADLTGADLSGSNLSSADLTGVVLSSTRLNSVDFTFSRLVNADLSQQDLSAAYFDNSNMSGATLNRIQLSGGLLDRVDLSGTDLRYADLSGSWINLSTLVSADMESAKLSGASLIGSDLTGANLSGASLAGANLIGALLRGADLRGADLSEAQLVATAELLEKDKQADITLQKMSDTQWEKLNLSDTDLDGIKYDDRTLWPKDFEIPKNAIYQPGTYINPVVKAPSSDFVLLRVSGSSTVYDLVNPLAKAYMREHPNVFFDYIPSNSAAGINDVATGVAHIGMASRPLSDSEKSSHKFLNEIQIGKDSIIAVVNLDNPIEGLTLDQLRKLYKGEITNWKQIGGDDVPVTLVFPLTALGDYFAGNVMKDVPITKVGLVEAVSYPVIRALISGTRGAIGLMPPRSSDNSIKVIMLDGYLPTLENVQSGKYPIVRPLNLVYHYESINRVQPWLDFISSSAGKQIILQEGFDPAE